MTRTTRRSMAIGACVALAMTLAGCGDDTKSSTTTAPSSSGPTKDATLAAMVPKDIADKGVLSVGSDTSYAPSEFLDTDNSTPIGFDVDLIKAVATTLGLKANVQTSDFTAIIPGITQSKKFDIGVSSFSINAERLQQVDMVSYYSAGTAWAVGANGSVDPDNACGKKVAVQTGTVQADDIAERSTKCTEAGKSAIQVDQYSKQDDATQAIVSGKDDAMLADSPVTAYAIKQLNGKLKAAGDIYGSAPYGYAIAKNNGDLGKALQGAVKALIASGEYGKILEKWAVQAGAVAADKVLINPPVS